MKQIAVFGASGKVGKLVVKELLDDGYKVVAFVRSKSPFKASSNLSVIKGDIHSPQDVAEAIRGSVAVISTLGSWHTPSKDIVSTAMRNIVPVMESQKIERIVSLTGSDALVYGDKVGIFTKLLRPFIKIIAGKILYDGEEHINILRASQLNWTVVRSPIMKNKSKNRNFVLNHTRPKPWQTIPRDSVAAAIVSLVETDRFKRNSPFVH